MMSMSPRASTNQRQRQNCEADNFVGWLKPRPTFKTKHVRLLYLNFPYNSLLTLTLQFGNKKIQNASNGLPRPRPSPPIILIPASQLLPRSNHAHDTKKHPLLCASGSVASIKTQILSALSAHAHVSIRLILNPSASTFLSGQSSEQPTLASLLEIPNVDGIYGDVSEWAKPWERKRSDTTY